MVFEKENRVCGTVKEAALCPADFLPQLLIADYSMQVHCELP